MPPSEQSRSTFAHFMPVAAAKSRSQGSSASSRPPPSGRRIITQAAFGVESAARGSTGNERTFGDYSLDVVRGVLHYQRRPVHLEAQVAKVLCYLVQNAGRLVSRAELQEKAWSDGRTTPEALNYAISSARKALNAYPHRAIVLVRGAGYRFVADVSPVRTESDPDRVIGRAEELQTLRRVAASVVRYGDVRGLLITGSAGMGKSRLLHQLLLEWAAQGARWVSGNCSQGTGAPTLWPWRSLLADLGLADVAHSGLRQPFLLRSANACGAERYEYFASVRAQLEGAAQAGPLLVALEDLHAADEATRALFRFLVDCPRPVPILYVGSCRTPWLDPARALFTDLPRHVRTLAVERLGPESSAELLRCTVERTLPLEVERWVLGRADGNPLYIRELGAAHLTPSGSTAKLFFAGMPSCIGDSIQWHLSGLASRTRELLGVAAVIGQEFEVHALASAVQLPPAMVLSTLASATPLQVIRPASPLAFKFAHALFRDYLYNLLPDEVRRTTHWRVGSYYAEQPAESTLDGLKLIAFHLREGAVTREQAATASKWAQPADNARGLGPMFAGARSD